MSSNKITRRRDVSTFQAPLTSSSVLTTSKPARNNIAMDFYFSKLKLKVKEQKRVRITETKKCNKTSFYLFLEVFNNVHQGSSINYVSTSEGEGGWEMLMVADGMGGGYFGC